MRGQGTAQTIRCCAQATKSVLLLFVSRHVVCLFTKQTNNKSKHKQVAEMVVALKARGLPDSDVQDRYKAELHRLNRVFFEPQKKFQVFSLSLFALYFVFVCCLSCYVCLFVVICVCVRFL